MSKKKLLREFEKKFRCQHCFYGRGDGFHAIITPDGEKRDKDDKWSYTRIAEPEDIEQFLSQALDTMREEERIKVLAEIMVFLQEYPKNKKTKADLLKIDLYYFISKLKTKGGEHDKK